MTTFEITIIVLLVAIVVLLILVFTGMATTYVKMKEGFECLAKKIEYCDSKLGYIKGAAQDISQQLDNIEDNILDDLRDIRIIDKCVSDLAVNVKGNYNTLERQQEDIGYIRTRINHILSLLHPAEEVIKSGGPTALDGLSNVQKNNANKSTNYNGYDPTSIVRGSESTNKED